MKFAIINIETIGFHNRTEKAHINFGDHLQNIVIKDLYKRIGIPQDEIYELDFNEISTYDGEYLILPINQAISHNISKFLSPKIIPVFLGLSRDPSAITHEEEEYFKKYSPIGCRDEALFNYLTTQNIKCYLNGCITVTLDKREISSEQNKIYVIEAPQYAIDSMPESIKSKAIYLENTFFGTYPELVGNNTLEDVVRDRYKLLRETASLVITSRMHIASPCVGMGIPVVLVRNSIDYRFSWLDKYIPVYSPNDVNVINWFPQPVDGIEDVKKRIIEFAAKRIMDTKKSFSDMLEISDFYELRNKVIYDLPQFSKKAIDFVKCKWSKNDIWNYSIWGENDASEVLYNFLSENYPNAHFVAFYDTYKDITYHGQKAKRPLEITTNDDSFIFVTGYTATDSAREFFQSIGRESSSYFLFESVVRGNK